MSDPLVRFGLRIKSRLALDEVASRVNRALDCQMKLTNKSDSDPPMYEGISLGLRTNLAFWPYLEEGELRTYTLTGNPYRGPIEEWTEIISISDFILNVLREKDSSEWYIPSKKELIEG